MYLYKIIKNIIITLALEIWIFQLSMYLFTKLCLEVASVRYMGPLVGLELTCNCFLV